MSVFSTQLCEPLVCYPSNLLSGSSFLPSNLPVWKKYTLYTFNGGGGGGHQVIGEEWASDRWTPAAKSLYRLSVLDDILLWCLYTKLVHGQEGKKAYHAGHVDVRLLE